MLNIDSVKMSGEYEITRNYLEDHSHSILTMEDIDRGIEQLLGLKTSVEVISAYVLHPVVTRDDYLEEFISLYKDFQESLVLAYVMEFRNCYQSFTVDNSVLDANPIVSPIGEVNMIMRLVKEQEYDKVDKDDISIEAHYQKWFSFLNK